MPADLDRIADLIAAELNDRLGNGHPSCPPNGCGCAATHCVEHCPDRLRRLVESGAERFSAGPGIDACDNVLARMIDHTLLAPGATRREVDALCDEAEANCFASVCVNPWWVRRCAERLAESPVKVCTVIGFPLGANRTETKAYEAVRAVEDGATELDMVLNVGALKSGAYTDVERDVEGVVKAGRSRAIVKVILETALLSDEEKVKACVLAKSAGARFVKTSTGFGGGGATVADVALMRRVVGGELGVKASGGVGDQATALEMIEAGATRIGASAGVRIVRGNGDVAERAYGAEPASDPSTPSASGDGREVAASVIPAPRATIHRLR